ncbi:hypothetical protein ACIG0A_33125 [Streptomyces californicus]|uniref:hypothetical protein n=1 Tax=Streptomyces californicus TaxID=67351 RepID=UPI0037D47068
MKTHSNPPTGYIVITPGPGPYDRECADIVNVIQQALDADETVTIHQGKPGSDPEAMYAAGENSGYADWDNALDGLLPDDVEPLPTQVAEYVRKLQQENARLRATTAQ